MNETTISEEDLVNISVGTQEPKKGTTLSAKPVLVMEISAKPIKGKNGRPEWESISIIVKHPDKEENIGIGKMAYLKDKAVKTVSISLDLDSEKKIAKRSGLAHLLTYYNVQSLKDLKGKTLQTEVGDNGFLVIKAY